MPRIGLIGDFDTTVPAHRAIPVALRLAGDALALAVEAEWIPTEDIRDPSREVGIGHRDCLGPRWYALHESVVGEDAVDDAPPPAIAEEAQDVVRRTDPHDAAAR
jgi:hypothetical protein